MKCITQDKEYNCGPTALRFLLGLYDIDATVEQLEELTGCTEADGTSHDGIKKALLHFGLKWVSWDGAHVSTLEEFLPAIVNYQYCDNDGCDGHYSVILGHGHNLFVLYNPFNGEIETIPDDELQKKWYSQRYGKEWFIQIINPKL